MILPTKHIPVELSLLGIGAELLRQLHQPRTVSTLWEAVRETSTVGSFQKFSLALALLYLMDTIEIQSGRVRRKVQ
jgi:hypothetical protein